MGIIKTAYTFLRSGFSTEYFYKSMNMAFEKYYGSYMMLHFPYYQSDSDNLLDGQKNLTHYCLSQIPEIKDKRVLEIGCGNGMQSMYLYSEFEPKHITGIDINEHSIAIAKAEKANRKLIDIEFHVDNAQELSCIPDNSVDVVINIESAFHYPDKKRFISEIYRVLKPDGHFIIADIINRDENRRLPSKKWNKSMNLHHWTHDEYIKAFSLNKLAVHAHNDITPMIIKGFRTYPNWIVKDKSVKFAYNMMILIFLFINVRINIFLFSKRRKYFVYSGQKLHFG